MTKMTGFDYPSEEDVERVRLWDRKDIAAGLDFVFELWSDYGSVRRELTAGEAEVIHAAAGEKYLRLATGGWSGNEDIINAMQENTGLWMCWRLTACGGMHIFRYPKEQE